MKIKNNTIYELLTETNYGERKESSPIFFSQPEFKGQLPFISGSQALSLVSVP